ncbi:MAG TPA: hypothetical protein ENF30_02805 [Candidatus Desulfofervidus auxilii]|uniref:6-bladed beta-propeller n=1 Tax=Desulfofervidus auxilii TaxID=1621989 RepID=A0A7V0IAP6_DESA2|nr:hypothetical protein [Candidatus Desulfofervidus auxilii]
MEYKNDVKKWLLVFFIFSFCSNLFAQLPQEKPVKAKLTPHILHLFDLREGIEKDFLSYPSYVAVDPTTKEIYVVDGGHGRIIIYTQDGYPLFVLDKNNGVEAPAGLWIDKEGYIYLCQTKTSGKMVGRISIFNPCLKWVRDIFFEGFTGAKAFMPRTIAIGKDKKIYVSGNGFPGVVVLDKAGKFLHIISPQDELTGIKGKADICAVYIDNNGRIYLLSEGYGRIYVYDKNEKFLFKFGQKGGSSGKLSRPRGIAVDEKNQWIFVVDYMRHTISVYTYQGKYLFEFGGKGWGAGWFQYPNGIWVDPTQKVLVADTFNQRIQVLRVKAILSSEEEKRGILTPGFRIKLEK